MAFTASLVWTKQADGSYTEPSGRLKIALWKQTRRYRLFEGGDGNSYIHTGSLASCKQRADTLAVSLGAFPGPFVEESLAAAASVRHLPGTPNEDERAETVQILEGAIQSAAEEFQSIDRTSRQAEPVEIAVPSDGDLIALVRDKDQVTADLQSTLQAEPAIVPVPAAEQRTRAKKAGNASEPLPRAAKPKAVDVQEAVNKLVLRHGRNVHEWADWPELLTAEGVDPSAVTDRTLQLARDAAVLAEFVGPVEAEAETPDGITWSLEPTYEEWAASSVHFWQSACGRYRLCRVADNDGKSVYYGAEVRVLDRWDAIGHSPLGPGYPKKHDSLEAAAKAALKYHCDKYHLEGCPTNADELLASVQALIESLEGPSESAQPDDEGETMATKTKAAKADTLRVPELAARKLLTALGSEGAAEQDGGKYVWTRGKLLASLKALPSDRAECDPVSGADAELLDRIEAALKGGGGLELVPEGEEETVETKTKKGSSKAAKKEAKPARNGKQKAGANGKAKLTKAASGPFGYSLTAVCKWMGTQGFDFPKAEKALKSLGVKDYNPISVKTAISDGRSEKYRKGAAELTRDQAREIRDAVKG